MCYMLISSRMGCMLIQSSFTYNSPMVQMQHVTRLPARSQPVPRGLPLLLRRQLPR